MPAVRDLPLRLGDLLHRAAKVDRGRARAVGRAPRDGSVERPVHLEGARSVPVPGKPVAIAGWKVRRRDLEHARGHEVEQGDAVRWEVVERGDPVLDRDLATELVES